MMLMGFKMAGIRRSRRSQAAMEYVHTYGWVLLAIVVLGGATIYYNVSNSQELVPGGCIFLSGLDCMDHYVDGNLLYLVLVNEFGFAMGNISVQITGTCNSTANTTDGNPYSNPNVLVENQQDTFVFECQNLTQMRLSEKIQLDYITVDTGQHHTKFGTLEYTPGE